MAGVPAGIEGSPTAIGATAIAMEVTPISLAIIPIQLAGTPIQLADPARIPVMTSAEREPCPVCGETVPLATTACPFCKASLRVDVALAAPVVDERLRYQLARAIASLGPPAPSFSTAQRALEDPRPVLARGLSKLAARDLLAALSDFGIAATAETAGTLAPRSSAGARRLGMLAALGAVIAGLSFIAMRHGAPPDRPAPVSLRSIPARSIPWSTPSPPLSLKDLSVLAAPATVEVRCNDRRSSGFFVARDVVLTHTATTDGCAAVEVAAGGATFPGEVTQQDSRLGLALVRATGPGAEPLRLGDAASLHSGDRIILLGAPDGRSTVREAWMGTAARQLNGLAFLPISGDVQPGDAGGPVLDEHGFVVGLLAGRDEGGEPFLLPINYAYEESHLLEKPSPAPDPRKWKALLAEVALAEKLRVEPSPDSGTPAPQSPSIQ